MSSCTSHAASVSLSIDAGRARAAEIGSRTSRCRSRATAMFSATVIDGKMRASWKERPMPAHVRPVEQLVRGTAEADVTLLHEHRPLGESEGDVDRLLDDDHGRALLVDLAHDLD